MHIPFPILMLLIFACAACVASLPAVYRYGWRHGLEDANPKPLAAGDWPASTNRDELRRQYAEKDAAGQRPPLSAFEREQAKGAANAVTADGSSAWERRQAEGARNAVLHTPAHKVIPLRVLDEPPRAHACECRPELAEAGVCQTHGTCHRDAISTQKVAA